MKSVRPLFISALVLAFFLGTFIVPLPSSTIRQTQLSPLADFGAFAGSADRPISQNARKSDNLARRLARDAARKARASQITVVNYRIKSGDTYSRILSKYGTSVETANLAERALLRAGVSEKLRIGEAIDLHFSRAGEFLGLRRSLRDGKFVKLRHESPGQYRAELIEPVIIEEEKMISGSIESSLARAARTADIPYAMIDEMADVLGNKINFSRDLQPGDTFTLVYTERKTEDGSLLTPGPLKAAAVSISGDLYAAVRHVGKDGKARYFDREGNAFGNYFLKYPVTFTRVSSVFSDSRLHPVLKVRRPHNGVDFAAPNGTPIRAVADGIVEKAGYNGGSGNMIMIRHDQRYTTGYLHLSKFAPGIRKGTRVTRGQYIGNVGTTGLSTGPHLHFSLFDRGRYTDPMKANLPMITPKDAQIPRQYLASILDTLRGEHKKIVMAANSDSLDSRS